MMEKIKGGRFRALFADPVFSEAGLNEGISQTPSKSWRSNARYTPPSVKTTDCYYAVIDCKKKPLPDSKEAWDSWNGVFISILHNNQYLFGRSEVLLSEIKKIAAEIPRTYAVWSKINQIEDELFDDEDLANCHVNVKSFFSMIRFLPAIEDKSKELSFYFNEDSRSFGFVLAKSAHAKQRLDLRFKDNGEILFSFIDGAEGFSRISGTSYLTDYLSNSSKIRKIINLFDH